MERSRQGNEEILNGFITGLEWAGIIGVIPWSFTLQELHIMMMSKQCADWERFALLTASVKNILVSDKKNLIKADDLNPYRKKKQFPRQEKVEKMDKKFIVNIFENRYGKRRKN